MITYAVNVDEHGNQEWTQNGELHRVDGPAVIYADGTQKWFRNNELHREDGPAIIWHNGKQDWYLDGKQYTEDSLNKKLKSTCEGKVVEINGKKYRLTAV